MLYNLIYRSKISNGLTDELLMELANKSNQANLDKGLSGLLLHNSTHFLQILEGPKEHIENLYQKIRKDPRHSEVVLIALEPIPLRLHSELGMKFINANDLDEIATYLPTIYQDNELPTINSSYNSRTKKFINQFTDKNTSNSFFNLGKIKTKIDANKIKRSEILRIANAPNKNQFAFQPVVDIIQKRTFFVEALIRGPKGEKAEEYLANMNKDDLKIFDMHSTSDAIALAAQLNIPNLSVNFNPKTLFETENIVDILEEMLSKYGFNNNQLIIEITEKDIKKVVDGDIVIQDEDFPDNGVAYHKIKDEIFDIHLDIPLSPIDYIINKIENTARPVWDNYGDGSPNFTVGEVTGRKFTLVKQPNGKFKLESNKKPKNKGETFKKFNSGFYDVLLINESGSTGEDAHSSSKFADQRPRVMIIHQVELDVNTEVQKRGRINRTGMVNFPTYIYAVSRIPSEIRRLLMLVRKLRSLDANTTANQKQSAKLSALKDSFGNEIEDVINKYGDEVLNEFISDVANESYAKYMPKDEQGKLAELSNSFIIEVFVRNLELSLSDEQEYFYNTINALYIQKKENLGADFDLETNIVDLKASIKTRVLVSKGFSYK